MCEIYVKSEAYPLFDGYTLNNEKAVTRYEVKNDEPIKCGIRKPRIMRCECGNKLIPLAYKYDNGLMHSRVMMGRKCIRCGKNYFTQKTISMYPKGFLIDENAYIQSTPEITNENVIKRGDVYFADLNGIENYCGSEQAGKRPVLVIQNDKGNKYSDTTIVAIITSKIKRKELPTHVKLPTNFMPQKSMVCAEQIKTIDKKRLGNYINNVLSFDGSIMDKVDKAIKKSLELI